MDKYQQHVIDPAREAVIQLLKDIEHHHFLICHTTGGAVAIVFSRAGKGYKPLVGAYFTGEEWLPAKWTEDGFFLDSDTPRALDLDFSQHVSFDPAEPTAA